MNRTFICLIILTMILSSCTGGNKKSTMDNSKSSQFSGAPGEVKLMILDPGHFHAALVQKSMYEQIDPVVHVYAPESPDVENYLGIIKAYNTRQQNPTAWQQQVYTGPNYLEKMLDEKSGNVMVVSGNNEKKTEYILKAARSGINVLADKPMVIEPEDFSELEKAFEIAEEKGILLYDIMTERFEITTILQREISKIPEVFGKLQTGSPEKPAITKESVHHFFKYVSGNPIKRPAWFFDAGQQGESIADVGTHLVDLIQWEAFPEEILKKEDVEMLKARVWSTELTPEMFKKVTGLDNYPGFLKKYTDGDILKVSSNGEMFYKLRGIHAHVSVKWDFRAPEGTGDTHYSIMRGTKCNLIIQQGEEEGYKPMLYIEADPDTDPAVFSENLKKAIETEISEKYPGIELEKLSSNKWRINIPENYRLGHEAHFAQVTEKYLNFLIEGKMPEWEVPNMIVKYYTTTEGVKAAKEWESDQ